jgi:hypothetical protein
MQSSSRWVSFSCLAAALSAEGGGDKWLMRPVRRRFAVHQTRLRAPWSARFEKRYFWVAARCARATATLGLEAFGKVAKS